MSTVQADANSGPQDPPAETDEYITAPAWYDDIPAWGISLLAHGAILLALTSISWVIVIEIKFYFDFVRPLGSVICSLFHSFCKIRTSSAGATYGYISFFVHVVGVCSLSISIGKE